MTGLQKGISRQYVFTIPMRGGELMGGRFITFLVPLLVLSMAIGFLLITVSEGRNASMQKVVPYTTIPGAIPSPIYTVQVNGQPIFVEKYKDIHYVRFAFKGSAEIRVQSMQPLNKMILSPLSYGIRTVQDQQSVTLTLHESRKLILHGDDREKLFIFADPIEQNIPRLTDANVVSISNYVNSNEDTEVLTENIQKAIDDAGAKPEGGVVYFPNGKYVTGTLRLRSNVTLYLESGALLMGSSEPMHYPNQSGTWGSLLYFDNVHHASITGRGVIDANGRAIRNRNDAAAIRIVRSKESSDLRFEDVYFRDSARWSFHLVYSEHVTLKDVKLINDLTVSNTDGVDPDSSRDILVDGMFQYTGDDTIAVKTTGSMNLLRTTENVTVRNCVFWNLKSSLKVGTETKADISHITFQNNDVVHADRAMALYMNDGSVMKHIRYIDNRAEEIGGDNAEKLLEFKISSRNGAGSICDVLIRNFSANRFSPRPSLIQGYDSEHQIVDITMENIIIEGRKRTSLEDAQIQLKNASRIQLIP